MMKSSPDKKRAPKKTRGKEMKAGTERNSGESARVDVRVQREIGKHLRAHYDTVINEPVPDKFIELLEQLARSVERKA